MLYPYPCGPLWKNKAAAHYVRVSPRFLNHVDLAIKSRITEENVLNSFPTESVRF